MQGHSAEYTAGCKPALLYCERARRRDAIHRVSNLWWGINSPPKSSSRLKPTGVSSTCQVFGQARTFVWATHAEGSALWMNAWRVRHRSCRGWDEWACVAPTGPGLAQAAPSEFPVHRTMPPCGPLRNGQGCRRGDGQREAAPRLYTPHVPCPTFAPGGVLWHNTGSGYAERDPLKK